MTSLLKESLANSLIHNNKSNLRSFFIIYSLETILISNDLLELLKLVVNDLFSHRVSNSVSVDENVIWHIASVIFSVSLECTCEVVLENIRRNNLLTFLSLRTCLGVVFTEVRIVCSYKTNDTLLSFMANINTN